MIYDLIIIGGGVAGITAGIYAVRSGLNCLLIEQGMAGGQITQSHMVENYPGFPSISGFDLSMKMYEHLTAQNVKTLTQTVTAVDLKGEIKTITTNKDSFQCKSVIIANGVKRRKLNVDGEQRLTGRGISYCAVCDGAFFKDKTVGVIGGGNVALEDALFLSNIAKQVYLIHRRNSFRGDAVLAERMAQCNNITVLYDTIITKIYGDSKLQSVDLSIKSQNSTWDAPEIIQTTQLELDGLFVAIGLTADNQLYKGQLELDSDGFIVAGEDCKTSLPGVFAAGDCRTKQLRQIITAAADGAIAADNARAGMPRRINV